MNNIIVAKFGGTSLSDAGQFKKVKSILMEDSRRKYVVPSAPGKRFEKDYKITDLLYLCHAHVNQGISFEEVFDVISKRYLELASELCISINLGKYLDEIKKNIAEGQTADYTASRGEYLNGLILADYLGFEFIDAAEVIFFNECGVFDAEKTQSVISKRLQEAPNAVIPGFYGSLPNGNVKTFSRGGSDITGAIVARGTNADLYENWTDVSGFLMADPRIVEKPKTIKKMTYRELRELSYMGSAVLHDEAIFPVRKAGIPINMRNTNVPSDPGTFIINDLEPNTSFGTITGIAGKKDFTVIAIEKAMLNAEIGIARKLLSILEVNGLSLEHMPSGIDSICLVISDHLLENKLDKIIDEIKLQCQPDSIDVYPNMALIATVGRGMSQTKGMAASMFQALADNRINVRMIDQGSSEINIIVGVENSDFEAAIGALYNHFTK
jgi:aspartate kinase